MGKQLRTSRFDSARCESRFESGSGAKDSVAEPCARSGVPLTASMPDTAHHSQKTSLSTLARGNQRLE